MRGCVPGGPAGTVDPISRPASSLARPGVVVVWIPVGSPTVRPRQRRRSPSRPLFASGPAASGPPGLASPGAASPGAAVAGCRVARCRVAGCRVARFRIAGCSTVRFRAAGFWATHHRGGRIAGVQALDQDGNDGVEDLTGWPVLRLGDEALGHPAERFPASSGSSPVARPCSWARMIRSVRSSIQ